MSEINGLGRREVGVLSPRSGAFTPKFRAEFGLLDGEAWISGLDLKFRAVITMKAAVPRNPALRIRCF